jgi:hypothetical protein
MKRVFLVARVFFLGCGVLGMVLSSMRVLAGRPSDADLDKMAANGIIWYNPNGEGFDVVEVTPCVGGSGTGAGTGEPWPGTTYLLPANDGTTAQEASFDLSRGVVRRPSDGIDIMPLVPNAVIGSNAAVGNNKKAVKLFRAGKTEYLDYYIGMQWTINEQPGTAPLSFAYDFSNELGDLPRMVKVTRTDDPSKAVFVSVLEAGPGKSEGGQYRNSGLSPKAMEALGFGGVGAINAQNYGEKGWLKYEWAPNATPGPTTGSIEGEEENDYDSSGDPCVGGGAVAVNMEAKAVLDAFNAAMDASGGRYGGYSVIGNGCTTLSKWFIENYTTLTYGGGNGAQVVSNLVSVNSGKNLQVTSTPVAPAIFSVAGKVAAFGTRGLSRCPKGSDVGCGHVGIVLEINGNKAVILHTGSSAAKDDSPSWAYNIGEYAFPANGVTFVNVGEYMK